MAKFLDGNLKISYSQLMTTTSLMDSIASRASHSHSMRIKPSAQRQIISNSKEKSFRVPISVTRPITRNIVSCSSTPPTIRKAKLQNNHRSQLHVNVQWTAIMVSAVKSWVFQSTKLTYKRSSQSYNNRDATL